MASDAERAIGRLEGQVTALTNQVSGLETKVDELVNAFHQMKGGGRVLMGAAAAAGAVAGAVAPWVSKKLGWS